MLATSERSASNADAQLRDRILKVKCSNPGGTTDLQHGKARRQAFIYRRIMQLVIPVFRHSDLKNAKMFQEWYWFIRAET